MIDVTKPEKYQTRDGRKVVALFYYPGNGSACRIVAHIMGKRGTVSTEAYYESGEFELNTESGDDLIEKPVFKPEPGKLYQFRPNSSPTTPWLIRPFKKTYNGYYVDAAGGVWNRCRPIPQEIKALMVFEGEE